MNIMFYISNRLYYSFENIAIDSEPDVSQKYNLLVEIWSQCGLLHF